MSIGNTTKIFYYGEYQNFTETRQVLGNNQPNITHSMNRLGNQLNCVCSLPAQPGRHPDAEANALLPASPRRQCEYRTRRKS